MLQMQNLIIINISYSTEIFTIHIIFHFNMNNFGLLQVLNRKFKFRQSDFNFTYFRHEYQLFNILFENSNNLKPIFRGEAN